MRININGYNTYVVKYTYNNGFQGTQEVLSKCNNSTELYSIIEKQLSRCKRARFKVAIKTNNKTKIVDGWLLNMDIREFTIE